MAKEILFPVGVIHRKIASGAILSEALLVPEISRLASDSKSAVRSLTRVLSKFLAECEPPDYWRRRGCTTARSLTFTINLAPPRANRCWREPIELKFQAVVWENQGHILARIPAVGIECIADSRDDLTELLARETLSALRRTNATVSLHSIASQAWTAPQRIEWVQVPVQIRTLIERADRANEERANQKSTLREVATELVPSRQSPAYEVDDAVRLVLDALTAKPAQSVLLVGPSGAGKSAIVREMIRQKSRFGLGDTAVFQTSGSRIVAGQCGFGMWEQRCQNLVKDAIQQQVILHLGPLAELIDVGKSEFNTSGIASFLRPSIARGELLAIAECTPEQLPMIEKDCPQLTDAFRIISIDEPDRDHGLKILNAFAAANPRRMLTRSALHAIDRLHRRYATYSAYPGRPLRFLENLIRDGEPGTPIDEADIYEAFTRETGLPRTIIDPNIAFDREAASRWFSNRVIGQPDAIQIAIELLTTIKAGLTRTDRPIASLMFIGPTGVGKTELAKALAEFLFSSSDRLTRFDMSEFSDPISVRRLIGIGSQSEGLLTAKVREQPFTVLLLDEIEKAHSSAFDLLLQVLGEARLTDSGGRLADFRNTVVIMTSNLGAESFRIGRPGFGSSGSIAADIQSHFTRAVEQFLRPEMFNRFDRIVPFHSLSAEVIRQIADREWHKVLNRDGLRFRSANISIDDRLLDHLATIGFDPRYGARPLKRAIERELLAPLAQQLNRHIAQVPLTIRVSMEEQKPSVSVRPLSISSPSAHPTTNSPLSTTVEEVQKLRRWHQHLGQSTVVRELENTITHLELRERRLQRRLQGWLQGRQKTEQAISRELQTVLAELGRLRDIQNEIRRLQLQAEQLEDDTLHAILASVDVPELATRLASANADWDLLLHRIYELHTPGTKQIGLHLFAESRTTLADLVNGYRYVARHYGIRTELIRYRLAGHQPAITRNEKLPPEADRNHPAVSYWHQNQLFSKSESPHRIILWRESIAADCDPMEKDDVIGFGIRMIGSKAHLLFSAEAGWYQFDKPHPPDADTADALIYVNSDSLTNFVPDESLVRKGSIRGEHVRRIYDRAKASAFDIEWIKLQNSPYLTDSTGGFHQLLRASIELTVRSRLLQMILE